MKLLALTLIAFMLGSCGGGGGQEGNSPPLTGTWRGILTQQEGGTKPEFNYEIIIADSGGGQYSGTSKITVIQDNEYYGLLNLSATLSDGILTFEETTLIENNPEPSSRWCIKSGVLTLDEDRLTGNWTAPGCAPGSIFLERSASPSRWFEDLPDCPCIFSDAIDNSTEANNLGISGTWELSNPPLSTNHPGAANTLRWTPENGGSGQQCTYNDNGLLITGGLAAGTPDFLSTDDSVYFHWMADVLSFEESALLDLIATEDDFDVFTCEQYFHLYPPNQGASCGFSNVVNEASFTNASTQSCRAIIDNLSNP